MNTPNMGKGSVRSKQDEALQQIEISLAQARNTIERAEALSRLRDNKDFKLLFMEGYFRDEAARLVLLKADPNMQEESKQQQVNNMLTAIGYVSQYLNAVAQLGAMAQRAIQENEQTREEIIAEEFNQDEE